MGNVPRAKSSKIRVVAGDSTRVVGYIRVSTTEQKLGPEAQRSAIDAWCTSRGFTLVAVEEDIGLSGGLPPEDRPGLLASIEAVREQRAGLWVCVARDRIARESRYAAMVEILVERAGGQVRTLEDGDGDRDDPNEVIIRAIRDVFAQVERAKIRGRILAAIRVKRARGERLGAIPYGYALSEDGRTLTVDAHEQRVVQRVRELRGEGASLRSVGALLLLEGLHPRAGGSWHPYAIQRIADGEG